ncbi:hypothetical protein CTEN210_17521 [Chaetoceros tenuissimus]|uniref:Mitochondrial fission process protein 1 n=1 Tax=Chaetoceros tenuissimus TaxID=426638 RepID=A0AAD3DDL9_9STRA|nr:hypothetical protein CTEN210_17521 [Chaetoceros tenuissimus]
MKTEKSQDGTSQNKEYNVFRDSLLRFMGYANEVGESFRYQFPKLVAPTYVLAFGYCAADSLNAGYTKWNEDDSKRKINNQSLVSKEYEIAYAVGDTLLWQCFASVLIPGGIINVIVRASRFAIARPALGGLPSGIKKWSPTAVGLGSIPFIVHPIDTFVDMVMDETTRKWFKK